MTDAADKRKFVRHPSDIPIEYEHDLSGIVAHDTDYLNNISFGGLSFQAKKHLEEGSLVNVRIPFVKPVFEIKSRVVWCKGVDDRFDVGVEFLEREKLFRARMVEQVCHIEHYKKQTLEEEGRALTGEEAALEWIAKHAAEFPSL